MTPTTKETAVAPDFAGKTALITGAGHSIGQAIALGHERLAESRRVMQAPLAEGRRERHGRRPRRPQRMVARLDGHPRPFG